MYDFLKQPWPWYIVGPLIGLTMVLLLLFGKRFGVSRNFQTMCSMAGAGALAQYFKGDWKKQIWNLVFVLGSMAGGYIAYHYMSEDPYVMVSGNTEKFLHSLGIESAGTAYQPGELFSWNGFENNSGWLFIILGGFLVGFGTRYAQGCTSGHAISGLSNFQIPSLIAVIGFFAGGLLVTWYIIPWLLQ